MRNKRTVLLWLVLLSAVFLLGATFGRRDTLTGTSPIRVGILHSLTGTMSISEQSVVDATILAIEEINADGGLLGQTIEIVLRDGQSDGEVFARKADKLIEQDRVAVIFGCWTSASRKHVLPVVERHQHLLFYPVQYEGMESSPYIVYTGSAPNQQIMPAVKWAMDHIGNRMYLIGSDYIFPHAANAIISDQLTAMHGSVVGEAYVTLGATEMDVIIQDIRATQPDVILNTLNGDSNIAFFSALRKAGITAQDIPTISFSITETEVQPIGAALLAGDYTVWTYFQSVDRERNRQFTKAFKSRFGQDRVLTAPMEAAYIGVHLWAQAVEKTLSVDPSMVRPVLGGMSWAAPQGPVSVDSSSQHLWKSVRIGQFLHTGEIDIVWSSSKPVRPLPYPPYRSRDSWHKFLMERYESWGGAWERPAPSTPPGGAHP